MLGALAGAGSIVVLSGETSRQEWDGTGLGFEDVEMGGGDKDDEIGLLAQELLECQVRTGFPTAARLSNAHQPQAPPLPAARHLTTDLRDPQQAGP